MPNSTLYQYAITSINDTGESEASQIINLTTLAEIAPRQPQNLSVSSNQNSMDLSWNYVSGYGDPIGGAAVSYNIYRFNITGFEIDSIFFRSK